MEILRQDDKNPLTLANLAAIQLELNHLEEAEKHVQQALTMAPDDGYSLSILGYLRFRQEKYDEAFDALSRAARLNPQSAEIQNYLGVTLSHKGLRGPADDSRPGVDEAGGRWLSAKGIFAAGSDTIAFELVPSQMPVHAHFLVEKGIHIMEALDLEPLAADGVAEFAFVAIPLKLAGGTGSPIRPIALV